MFPLHVASKNKQRKMALPKGHFFLNPQNFSEKFKVFFRQQKPGTTVTQCQGLWYRHTPREDGDGNVTWEMREIREDDWKDLKVPSEMKSPQKQRPQKPSLVNTEVRFNEAANTNDDKVESVGSWADNVAGEKSNLQKAGLKLGGSSSFKKFGGGAAMPASPSAEVSNATNDENHNGAETVGNGVASAADDVTNVNTNTGRQKYSELLGNVDVIRLAVTHSSYRAGEQPPRPPDLREYRQLVQDIMRVNLDDVENLRPERRSAQTGHWSCYVKLKKRYDLRKSYESVKGKFQFGLKSDGKSFTPRWTAEIMGFDPENNVPKQKFKFKLAGEIGITPNMILAEAKKVMKITGKGIYKERYNVNTGLVDSKGMGIGTGFYYFWAIVEDGVVFPDYVKVGDWRIYLKKPERDRELEQQIKDDPSLRRDRRGLNPEGLNDSRLPPRPPRTQTRTPAAPKVMTDFTPNFASIMEEQAKENEKKAEAEAALRAEKEAGEAAKLEAEAAAKAEAEKAETKRDGEGEEEVEKEKEEDTKIEDSPSKAIPLPDLTGAGDAKVDDEVEDMELSKISGAHGDESTPLKNTENTETTAGDGSYNKEVDTGDDDDDGDEDDDDDESEEDNNDDKKAQDQNGSKKRKLSEEERAERVVRMKYAEGILDKSIGSMSQEKLAERSKGIEQEAGNVNEKLILCSVEEVARFNYYMEHGEEMTEFNALDRYQMLVERYDNGKKITDGEMYECLKIMEFKTESGKDIKTLQTGRLKGHFKRMRHQHDNNLAVLRKKSSKPGFSILGSFGF